MDYIDYLYSRKLTKNTIDSYVYDLNLFKEFLGERDINTTEKADILKYMVYLSRENYSEKSIARKVTALKSYFYYALNMGYVDKDPTFQIDTPRVEQGSKKNIYPLEDLNKFINYPLEDDNKSLKSMRDFMLFNLLFYTGINLMDLLSKKISDIDLDLGFIIHKGKYIFLNESLVDFSRGYIEKLYSDFPDNIYLFINMSGGQLTRQGAWKIFNRYGTLLGIKIGAQNLIDGFKFYNEED